MSEEIPEYKVEKTSLRGKGWIVGEAKYGAATYLRLADITKIAIKTEQRDGGTAYDVVFSVGGESYRHAECETLIEAKIVCDQLVNTIETAENDNSKLTGVV